MSTQSDITKGSLSLEELQQFSSLQPKHTRRQMRQYVVTEAELNDISLLNTVVNWCFSAATGSLLFAVGLVVNACFQGTLTEKGIALLYFGAPAGGILALFFAIMGVLALQKKRSVLGELKRQSLDIDQTSLVTSPNLTQPTPSTPDKGGSQP